MSSDHIKRLLDEQEVLHADLEKRRKKLDLRSKELSRREALTEQEKQKLEEEKKKVISKSDVYLRSIHKPFDIVARGWVLSLDPKEVVGGKEIGTRYCSVNPQVAIQKDEELVRPYGHMDTIIEAIGTPIAWPRNFVEVVPLD